MGYVEVQVLLSWPTALRPQHELQALGPNSGPVLAGRHRELPTQAAKSKKLCIPCVHSRCPVSRSTPKDELFSTELGLSVRGIVTL